MYYFSKCASMSFEDAVATTREVLKRHYFTILAEIDLGKVLRRYLAVGSRPYIILTACSPQLAHKGIEADNEIGSMVLCNLLLQRHRDGRVEISAVDPAETIGTINHVELIWVTRELRSFVQQVIDHIAFRPASRPLVQNREKVGRQLVHALP